MAYTPKESAIRATARVGQNSSGGGPGGPNASATVAQQQQHGRGAERPAPADEVRQAADAGADVVVEIGQRVDEVRAGAEQATGGEQPHRRG